jgi:hypothetical protein
VRVFHVELFQNEPRPHGTVRHPSQDSRRRGSKGFDAATRPTDTTGLAIAAPVRLRKPGRPSRGSLLVYRPLQRCAHSRPLPGAATCSLRLIASYLLGVCPRSNLCKSKSYSNYAQYFMSISVITWSYQRVRSGRCGVPSRSPPDNYTQKMTESFVPVSLQGRCEGQGRTAGRGLLPFPTPRSGAPGSAGVSPGMCLACISHWTALGPSAARPLARFCPAHRLSSWSSFTAASTSVSPPPLFTRELTTS